MSSDRAFLAAAAAIGQRIVGDAVWHDGRCTWMGATTDRTLRWRLKYRALGPRVYEGTAGVGLFLAQLAAVTGEASARRAALGALRHALERAPSLPPADRDGLYAGVVGVALAAARVAAWLDEPELDAHARALMADAALPQGPRRCPDIVMGSAGTVIGCLALAEACDDAALVRRAVAAGDELLGRATVTPHGWSWASPGRRSPHHLCGIAHGASGIGWALLELFAATGDERFRTGAAGAFAYERSWLNTTSGTWPDLRIAGQRRGRSQTDGSATTGTWCRGEAGIAQTRLRAVALSGGEAERRDATFALATTRRHVAGLLAHEIEDLSLCHGATGSADVLLTVDERSPDAAALGQLVLERYVDGGEPWPYGVPGGVTPGLFLGLSGIGWWLLRLHDARIPSPLETWGLTASSGGA
jgi:lantibiotic modifying enzyme